MSSSQGGIVFAFVAVACAAMLVISFVIAIVFKIDIFGWLRDIPGLLRKILDVVLIPFKLFLRLFTGTTSLVPLDSPSQSTPGGGATTHTTITKNEIGQCPPCNVKCPDVPDVDANTKPLELEIKYLKNMLKFVGTISKRENAINAQYREIYPGFSVMCPSVQKLSTEYNYLKNQLREDETEYNYFKNYFTKLTGIASKSSAVHYDVVPA